MSATWSAAERRLLLIPIVAAAVSLIPFLIPEAFAAAVGHRADPFVLRLGSASAFGYAVGFLAGLRDGRRAALRHALVAGIVYSALVMVSTLTALATAAATPAALGLGATAVLTLAIALALVRGMPSGEGPTAPRWVVFLLVIATAAAFVFGVTPLVPQVFTPIFGYAATDDFTFRMAGAATAGYAAMGVSELRSPRWSEIRTPLLMALTFNGLSFLASALELVLGRVTLLAVLITVAAGVFTVGFIAALASARAEGSGEENVQHR